MAYFSFMIASSVICRVMGDDADMLPPRVRLAPAVEYRKVTSPEQVSVVVVRLPLPARSITAPELSVRLVMDASPPLNMSEAPPSTVPLEYWS